MGSLALTGSLTPFESQPIHIREKQLLSWKLSAVPHFRKIYDSLIKLGIVLYLRASPTLHKVMKYETPPADPPVGGHFQFKFSNIADLKNVELDAIIVGSGAGGGVTAKTLAEAGMKVVVIEKGKHFDHGGIYSETWSLQHMYDRAILAMNESGSISLVSANVFGGGATINWAACLETPEAVRADWTSTFGLPYFTSPEFQEDINYVNKVMGVSDPTNQNKQNKLLMEGARRMGYEHAPVKQNNGGQPHRCGHECANSCRSGGKRGISWLEDANKAGAHLLVGADVRRIIFKKGVAKGVSLIVDGKEATLNAPRIVVSGGSFFSPALLLRSKVPNPRIGASLYLHPTNYIYGVFPESTEPTKGNILTSVVSEYDNISPGGYGVRVETGIMQPIISMTLLQWIGGAEHKARLSKHSRMVGLIAIARDRDCGRLKIDKQGEPVIKYNVSAHDEKSIKAGTVAGAECLRAAGAEEILVGARGVSSWKKGDDWEGWRKQVEETSPASFGTAHQLGSCRMSSRSSDGVCDPTGALYGVKGVWVSDASVLPSSSGVNPMITVMAVAHKVAREVVRSWKAELASGSSPKRAPASPLSSASPMSSASSSSATTPALESPAVK